MFDRHAKLALVLVCVVLAASAIGFQVAVGYLNVYLRKEPVPLREHFDNLPMTVGSWKGQRADKLSIEMVEELGTNLYLDATYLRGNGRDARMLAFHLAYYTGFIDAVPHVPDRCLVAAGYNMVEQPTNLDLPLARRGWRTSGSETADGRAYERVIVSDPITGRPVTVHMPFGDFELRTSVYSMKKDPDLRLVAGYFFIANGEIAATPELVKKLAFDPTVKHAYYCKVQFSAIYPKEYVLEDFTELVADLLDTLLPQVMRCLPDWSEVEQNAASADPSSDAGATPAS